MTPLDPAPGIANRFCSECGQSWPQDDLARFGTRMVCPNCKDTFTQRMLEGSQAAGSLRYAGFWIRFVASLIDGVILGAAQMLVVFLVSPMLQRASSDTVVAIAALGYMLSILFGVTYEAFFLSRFGATPGKMALGLKVIRPDGGGLTVQRAVGRYFAKMLSGMTLTIGFIIAAFDDQKRSLHDHIVETRVVKVRP